MPPTLVIGSKAYSSWSLRPWLALKVAGIPFDETLIRIGEPETRTNILPHGPAGKVPILKDGNVIVWESLAIIEYAAEKWPDAGLLPADPVARALCRSISAEMHAGFLPLRRYYPMNLHRIPDAREPDPDADADITRIKSIWRDARARFGVGGPFLFGSFTAADAMFAPVVTRFDTYRITVPPELRLYMGAVLDLPAMKEWRAAAQNEPRNPKYSL